MHIYPAPIDARWRRWIQWVLFILFCALPFFKIDGLPVARLDVEGSVLYLAWLEVRFDDLFPLLLALLGCVFLFLFFAAGFGRLWCGWGCPQTIWAELAEWALPNKMGKALSVMAFHLFVAATAGFFALVTSFYFTDPYEFFTTPFTFGWGWGLAIALASIIYIDMAFMRRWFCKTICPYGKILTIFTGAKGLKVRPGPDSATDCIECGGCARVCPMDLDAHLASDPECIQCGECVMTCANVMAKRGKGSVLGFYFEGTGSPLSNRKAILFLASSLVFFMALTTLDLNRPRGKLYIKRGGSLEAIAVDDGSRRFHLTSWVTNLTDKRARYSLECVASGGEPVVLRGPVNDFTVEPRGRIRLEFFVELAKDQPGGQELTFMLRNGDDKPVAVARLELLE